MFPIRRFWDSLFCVVRGAALAAVLAVPSPGQTVVFPEVQDSSAVMENTAVIDSLVSELVDVSVSAENPVDTLPPNTRGMETSVKGTSANDAIAKETSERGISEENSRVKEKSASLKSVLYLGGGYRSPWFYVGALYAIEEYKIPVDSLVGTSWGAFVGSLWSRGVSVDEIQRILLDSAIVSYVGQDLSREPMAEKTGREIEISPSGISALRQRFTLSVDSSGNVRRNLRPLNLDSSYVSRLLARIRFQESLYRQEEKRRIPFAVQGCEGVLGENSVEAVIASLPLWKMPGDDNPKVSGEHCPHYATPAEDRPGELPLMVIAEPLRGKLQGDELYGVLVQKAASHLANQPGVIIRAHSIQDTSRNAWIQAGFSAVERKLTEIRSLLNRTADYGSKASNAALPWFRFTPSFEGVSSEIHSAVNSRWNESDTGLVAALNFARSIGGNPAYDSLSMGMLPSGELMVGLTAHPTFDVAAGGFGSNAIGPNAYFEASVHFVEQMEIQLALKGFWGSSSFGFQPRLDVSRLWNKHWSAHFGYDYMKLRPLKTFNNGVDRRIRIEEEERSDFTMSLAYQIDDCQSAYVDFLFGHRDFTMDTYIFGTKPVKTYPVSPMLHYNFSQGDVSRWFSREGVVLDVGAGLQSVAFDFGVNDVIPIYWKLVADARYSHSPKSYFTYSIGASAGMERYHEDGYGYVNPASFGYAPLDIAYRMHGSVTPWLEEWYSGELSSHEYALVRASGSVHNRYLGVWMFGAFFHDFEDSPYAQLSQNKFILEPALYFAYKSIKIYAGLNRIVDKDSFEKLKHLKDYDYFIRIGEYRF